MRISDWSSDVGSSDLPLAALAKTLTRVFFHDGTYSSFRGRTHGRPVDRTSTPAHRFLGYAQTHDQIGNRALGDRLSATHSPGSSEERRGGKECATTFRYGVAPVS